MDRPIIFNERKRHEKQRINEHQRKYYKKFKKIHGFTYHSLHKWVHENKERVGVCSICNQKKFTEWSNISGEYHWDLNDFQEVCKKCHKKYDIETGDIARKQT